MTQKKKITVECAIRASAQILFNYLSTPSGLSQWFANDVDINKDIYKFKWDGQESEAQMVKKATNKSIRYRWLDSPEEEYFEFDIVQDELTGDIALVITDFVDPGDESESALLWESQVKELRNYLGG